jgi:NitT/TauT family transport system ATP-binding protein
MSTSDNTVDEKTMLDVDGLEHRYGHGAAAHHAIGGMSFSVAAGELVCVVGPSGCGKTTLLRSIAGLMKPTGGRVVVAGREVRGVPADLAVVFQDYSRSLYPWMTVRHNVEFPLSRRGLDRAARRERAEAALAAVGLEGIGRRRPGELSGGMQQRVAIARALAYRPKLMLMDEPFASVDAQTREDLEDLVLAVRAQQDVTIVFVTHDIDESVYLGDRVLVLTGAPSRVAASLPVPLGPGRDQIGTREDDTFVRLRAEIGRLIRRRDPAGPAEPQRPSGSDSPDATVH